MIRRLLSGLMLDTKVSTRANEAAYARPVLITIRRLPQQVGLTDFEVTVIQENKRNLSSGA